MIKRETDASSQMGGRHLFGPAGSTINTLTPCAACKLLRRRCTEECPFSPYFSPHEPQKFAAVHKVFGASNVSKMLMEVPESQRADAANSLVYEANLRLRDPIHGCMGAISALQQQIQSLQGELNEVRTLMMRHKFREVIGNNISSSTTAAADLVSSRVPAVSIASAPPPQTLPPPPEILSPLPFAVPSLSSSSSSSSLYTPRPTSTTGYSSIGNIVPYFD
ncbi:LOB domain-containing protein 13-like [Juglans microcarpa x Juglans regia]|uniref:LOB domain-containing protein 13-like n=1 Tax=Juglans microcarpa x Juglans regia TaxID=2249226 RepID=UPI001B7E1BD7|nr:LOB domain-containing protein 13-like [Juglans microcarpa x Juglans regia]XP_040993840.1 LOB domain-containing protein 13-like [Juglans microcarpa x Juglans regia]